MAPLLTPLIVLAVSIYALYSSLHMIGSTMGLIVAQTTLGLPMVVTAVTACLANVDEDLERAAAVLGARGRQTLVRVTLPMASSGMFTGFVLAFGISFDELLIAMFVAGITGQTLPVKIWEQLRTGVSPEITAAAAVLIMFSVALLVTIVVIQSVVRRRREREIAR
jgi:putative spermidine/putrescine transport system permease protein